MKTLKTLLIVMGMATAPLTQAASSATPAPTPAPAASTNQAQLEQQLQDARQQLQEAAHKVAELSMQLNGNAMRNLDMARERMEKATHRGFLGVDLDDEDDTNGVELSGVTPGGPAEKAGLREGDVITSINGTTFKASGEDSAGDKLEEFMRETKPGDSLKVAYSRDGKAATATVTAGKLRDMSGYTLSLDAPPMPRMPPMPPMPPMAPMAPRGPWDGFNMYFSNGGRWGEMQLVTLTSGLGQYFGTDKGLLVLHVPKDSALQLQEGDVITQLGGRDPGTPPHAMRILSSYGPGENVKIDIMRKGKPQTLNVTLPKAKEDGDTSNSYSYSYDYGDDDDSGSGGTR